MSSSSGYNKFAIDEMKFRGEDSHHQHCSDAQGNRDSRPTSKARANSSAHALGGGKEQIRFTPQMLQDQELLVSTMSQQGIPESLIKRHFDRLLEEQCKQVQVLETSALVQEQPIDNRLSGGGETFYRQQRDSPAAAAEQHMQYQQQQQQQEEEGVDTRPAEPHQQPKPRLEPSSLVRMRLEKEAKLLTRKNNGLQELAVAQEILSGNKYGHLSRNQCRLDGTQESEDMDRIAREIGLKQQERSGGSKKPSSNGLENSRRAGNPPSNSRSHALRQLLLAQERPVVYPPQRGDSIHCHRQRELGCCEQPQQQQQRPYANEQHQRQEVYELQKMQQHQQYQALEQQQQRQQVQQQQQQQQSQPSSAAPMYQQHQTHSNDLLEPRIIGGVTYLARRSHCIPQTSGF